MCKGARHDLAQSGKIVARLMAGPPAHIEALSERLDAESCSRRLGLVERGGVKPQTVFISIMAAIGTGAAVTLLGVQVAAERGQLGDIGAGVNLAIGASILWALCAVCALVMLCFRRFRSRWLFITIGAWLLILLAVVYMEQSGSSAPAAVGGPP